MNKVKIKTSIDLSNPTHLRAMNVFFDVLGGHSGSLIVGTTEQTVAAPLEVVEEKIEPTPKPRRTRRKVAEKVADEPTEKVADELTEKVAEIKEAAEKITEKVAEIAEKVTDSAESTVTIEEVRALLSKKVGDHRTAIKAKLSDLDAPNVSSLKEENYLEMHTFLTGLK